MTSRLPGPWRTIADWALTIAIAVGAVLLIKSYVINPYKIPSSSMEPTFHCASPGQGCSGKWNDRVIANRFLYHFEDPKRGQIVVFNPGPAAAQQCGEGGTYVKRLIGLPGDRVAYRNGRVYINGTLLNEPYIEPGRQGGKEGIWRVPKGDYFFMGDNRRFSCDSRLWGPVPRSSLIGPVFFVYWPLSRIGFR